jgi:hypothetical protein
MIFVPFIVKPSCVALCVIEIGKLEKFTILLVILSGFVLVSGLAVSLIACWCSEYGVCHTTAVDYFPAMCASYANIFCMGKQN